MISENLKLSNERCLKSFISTIPKQMNNIINFNVVLIVLLMSGNSVGFTKYIKYEMVNTFIMCVVLINSSMAPTRKNEIAAILPNKSIKSIIVKKNMFCCTLFILIY